MKTSIISSIIFLLLIGFHLKSEAKLLPEETVFQLQFQKSFFVSGEKIWFKNSMVSGHENSHQTILYVDLCSEGAIINSCIVERANNHWQGNLLIPDSLETGIYLFRAYTGDQNGKPEVVTKLIPVINRFGGNKTNEERKNKGYKPFGGIANLPANEGSLLRISASGHEFGASKPINFTIENNNPLLEAGISLSVFRTFTTDTLSENLEFPEREVFFQQKDQVKIYNKLTLGGKVVTKQSNEPVKGETLLFSVPDSVPQINYATTDSNGFFLFEVDKLYGLQDVIVQTVSKNSDLEIVLFPNLLPPPVKIPFYLSEEIEKSEYAVLAVKRAMFEQAYKQSNESKEGSTSFFKYPFYGTTSSVVIPDRFIELDNFAEIIKEILPLCRLKNDRNAPELKVYDPDGLRLYESPWIIVDGVPIFSIKPLLPLNSPKIRKIETITQTRCYGGLYIEGALAVFTKEGNYSTLSLPKNALRKTFTMLQPQSEYPNKENQDNLRTPDFRDVLFWKPVLDDFSGKQNVTVLSSYEKGNYIAIAQGVDRDGNVQRSVFEFQVK